MPTSIVTAIAVLVTWTASAADGWPHWRGPSRNGLVDESSGYRDGRWLDSKPDWQVNVGAGSTTPVIVDGRLYTLGWKTGRDTLVCLDVANGRENWSQSYEAPKYGRKAVGDQGIYAGICATPEFDAATGLLYTLGIDGELNCWDTGADGRRVWGLNLYEKYDVPQRPRVGRSGQRDYGFVSSPLLHGDWVVLEVGATNGNLIGFDKRTGSERWRSENTDPPGHTGGPVPLTVEGIPCVAVHTHEGIHVARLDGRNAGRTVGFHPWLTNFSNSIPSPTAHGSSLFVTSAYNHKKLARLNVSLRGIEVAWEQRYGANVCSPVVADGFVYSIAARLRCYEIETGKLVWEGGKYGAPASIVHTSDRRLITWSNRGDLTLIDTATRSPDEFRELSAVRGVLRRDAWPHVVLTGQRLFVRDRDGNLACFQVP